jgi:sporulation protein YlmC with PRC-barrel domain
MPRSLIAIAALPVAALAQAQMTHFITLGSDDMLSSDVVGIDVYDSANKDIGKIQDVAFDSSKAVKGYVVSVGGFLGMGTRYVAVDADSVKVKYDMSDKKWHANMNASKEETEGRARIQISGRMERQ